MRRKRDIKTRKVKKCKARLKAKVHFMVAEDNSGAIEITRINKY